MSIKTCIYSIVFLFSFSVPVFASWSIQENTDSAVKNATTAAMIENTAGYRLSIVRSDKDLISGVFTLKTGFDTFFNHACPTLIIDDRQPLSLFFHARSCLVKGDAIIFEIGEIKNNEIHSLVLNQLMDGNSVRVRFLLDKTGYRETRFSLSHSKQTLGQVLGNDTEVMRP